MSFIQLNLFDEIKACVEPKNDGDILEYLKEKYPQYKPKIGKWELPQMVFDKVLVYIDYREPSKYSAYELRNGFYSVGLDGGTFGESRPITNFEEAINVLEQLIKKAINYGKKKD